MKRLLPAIFFIHSLSFAQPGPDSGRNLAFSNSTTNRVNIPDAASFDHPDNNITIEAWINPTAYTADGINGEMIFSKAETIGTSEYYFFIQIDGILRFLLTDNSNVYYMTFSTTIVPLNTWTHVAATYSFSTGIARIYFNGILNVSNNIGSIILKSTATRPLIGAYWLSNNNVSRDHFEGSIDEVRLWHVERTQTEIRDNMCRTLVTPQANLIAYYRLDETTGTFANDASGNANNGTLENFTAPQIATRNFSGAPIGNVSIYGYPASWSGLSFSLGSSPPGADEGTLVVDNITGNPTGFHIFRVDTTPSQTGGLANPTNTYFGTFVVGGTSPTYRATYNYSGTAFDNGSCENKYNLHQRNDNSVSTWSLLNNTLDTAANTLTAANANNTGRKEIILDKYNNQKPQALNDFPSCIHQNDSTKINVLANDSDPDGDALLVSLLGVRHGTAQVLSNKKIKYTPSGFIGNDTIQYIITDSTCFPLSDTAFAVICVNCINHAPSAVNDFFTSICINSTQVFDVLANDSDPDNDSLTVSILSVRSGTAQVLVNNQISYTPPASGLSGNDTISYKISDNGCSGSLSDTAFAVICVNIVVIPPCTNHPPSAVNDVVSPCIDLCSNTSVNILANDSDPDGDPIYASLIKTLHGSAILLPNKTVQYTPDLSYIGSDTIYYLLCDSAPCSSYCVQAKVILCTSEKKLIIPNLFTPNGDHVNDKFEISGICEGFYIEIYNRWGELVFKENEYYNTWNGENESDGMYYYLIRDEKRDRRFRGWVSILR